MVGVSKRVTCMMMNARDKQRHIVTKGVREGERERERGKREMRERAR